MKRYCMLLAAMCLALLVLPAAGLADTYNAGDVAIINKIIAQSPTLSAKYKLDDPGKWSSDFVWWSEGDSDKRVKELYLTLSDFTGTLDVSGLSALVHLECNGNPNLTKLILPEQSNLSSLNCANCPNITVMNVSKNTQLEFLNLDGTPISSLDVSKLNNLKTLWCNNTNITSLNVSGNPNLEELHCGNTGITRLDLTQNPKLQVLSCDNTGITSLDLSQNKELIQLGCGNTGITSLDLTKNTNLKVLSCDNTGITSLDLSQNTELTQLNCDNTGITRLDISKNPKLKELSCNNTGITSLDLSDKTNLEYVRLPTHVKILTREGHSISVEQTAGGSLQIVIENNGGEGGMMYSLHAYPDPGYEFIRLTGVTDQAVTDPAVVYEGVSFRVTGDMTISAEFAKESRRMLSALSVEGAQLSPAFSPDVYHYTAAVGHDVSQINILAEAGEYEHRIEGDGVHALKVGENTFVVKLIVPMVPGVPIFDYPDEVFTEVYEITVTRVAALPDTGDDSRAGLWLGLMLVSVAALAVGAILRRRANSGNVQKDK